MSDPLRKIVIERAVLAALVNQAGGLNDIGEALPERSFPTVVQAAVASLRRWGLVKTSRRGAPGHPALYEITPLGRQRLAVLQADPVASDTTKPILASAIRDVSAAAKRLSAGGLNRDAVVALIADDTKISKKTIVKILDSIDGLAKR